MAKLGDVGGVAVSQEVFHQRLQEPLGPGLVTELISGGRGYVVFFTAYLALFSLVGALIRGTTAFLRSRRGF